jgi:hypothetical protein
VLTPESLFRVLNEFDGGAQVELDVLREEQQLTLTLELPPDHKRVLVDEEVSTAGAVNPDHQRIGNGDRTGRTATVEELQQIVAQQQQQIDWLYNALMDVANSTGVASNGWGAWPGVFPFGFAGGTGTGTDANGDGIIDQDANGDGLIDEDSNGDGIIDEDSDGDGVIDDVNGDGVLDRDIDGDGILDVDVTGDGVIDPSGQTPPDTTPMERLPIDKREGGIDVPPAQPEEPDRVRNPRRRDTARPPAQPGNAVPPTRRPAPTTSGPNTPVPGANQPIAPPAGTGGVAPGGGTGTP